MTTNTENSESFQTDSDGESSIIKELRQQVRDLKVDRKQLTATAEEALATARAQVKREAEASSLMSNAGFAGLADIFASEVDDELTAVTAAEWLKKRGLSASSETSEGDDTPAEQVGNVADLGSQIAAATQDASGASFTRKMDDAQANAKGMDAYFAELERIANEG